MEFPDLGEHCSLKECHRLDFLPIKCSACNKIFCGQHYQYERHGCENKNYGDHQIPVCPLCNQPVSMKFGESPDNVVSEHMDRNCVIKKEKVYKYRCSLENCRKKELLPLQCDKCGLNHCIKHRHPDDHDCKKISLDSSKKYCSINKNNEGKPHTMPRLIHIPSFGTFTQQIRKTFNRNNSESSRPVINPTAVNADVNRLQGDITEEEALNIAIAESLNVSNSQNDNSATTSTNAKNDENCQIT